MYLRKFSCDHCASSHAAIWVKSNRQLVLSIETCEPSALRARTSRTQIALLNSILNLESIREVEGRSKNR